MEMVNDMEVSNLFERADQDDDLFEQLGTKEKNILPQVTLDVLGY